MISTNVGVLLRDIFELLLNIFTYHLAENTPQKFLKILTKVLSRAQILTV